MKNPKKGVSMKFSTPTEALYTDKIEKQNWHQTAPSNSSSNFFNNKNILKVINSW